MTIEPYWYAVRLELARNPGFPEGSPARSYIVHVPIDLNDRIDAKALKHDGIRATVRRFWPQEPDLIGHIVRSNGDWAFSYRDGPEDDERLFRFGDHPLIEGNYVTVSEPDGDVLAYRVAERRLLN